MKSAFESVLGEIGLDANYTKVTSTEGVLVFRDNFLAGKEPESVVILFSFDA